MGPQAAVPLKAVLGEGRTVVLEVGQQGGAVLASAGGIADGVEPELDVRQQPERFQENRTQQDDLHVGGPVRRPHQLETELLELVRSVEAGAHLRQGHAFQGQLLDGRLLPPRPWRRPQLRPVASGPFEDARAETWGRSRTTSERAQARSCRGR